MRLIMNGRHLLEVVFDGYTQGFGLRSRINGNVNYGLAGQLHSFIVRGVASERTEKQIIRDLLTERIATGPRWARGRAPISTDGRRMGPLERERWCEV